MPDVQDDGASRRRGTLDDYLAAADIVPLPRLTEEAWAATQRACLGAMARQFCTLRNLWVHRGGYGRDSVGFAWGGIYRSLLVRSIVTTSYRNEGHLRAGDRIFGTGDFFRGGFVLATTSHDFRDLVQVVNLRHHVAGVVIPDGDGVRVLDGFEADYAYVAAAFVESIRRGFAACGLAPDSPRGRTVGQQFCTLLYHLAGFTGLTRVPRDLAAHERFRDAFDRQLATRPPAPRIARMAQEIARRIVPLTAAMSDESVRGHVGRHLDRDTAAFLFPGEPAGELEAERDEWRDTLRATSLEEGVRTRAERRVAIWRRPDVAALHEAYLAAGPDLTTDRLIGAVLLHALDAGRTGAQPLERRTIDLAAGESLIRQGESQSEMYVVLSTTAPLVVTQTTESSPEPRLVATLTAPTVLGEIGMWRHRPALATVVSRLPNRIEVLVVDAERFELLRHEPGFRVATAAAVQQRLAVNAAFVGTALADAAAKTGDRRLASVAQLVKYLSGDSDVPLDAVIDLPIEATPTECVEALRLQVAEAVEAGALDPALERSLAQVMATVG
jgi:CRP-like cAMP-binding protein